MASLNRVVEINLGGKNRKLIFDMNAMCEIEELFDISLMTNMEEFFSSLSFRKLRATVWAMLSREIPRPDINEVGDWISEANLAEVGKQIKEALTAGSDGPIDNSDDDTSDNKSDPTQG